MRPRVWLPPADDDDRHRQLDLLIYGETLSQALEAGREKYLQAIGNLPCVKELADSGMDILQAEQQWSTSVAELKKRLLEEEPYEQAAKAALRGTTVPWSHLRALVYERDHGVCQVCGDAIDLDSYECGHIIDRVVGGSDRLCNLVCMCISCNRLKPLTETREAYIVWASEGGPIRQIIANVIGRCMREHVGPDQRLAKSLLRKRRVRRSGSR
jgi:SOS response regulatory protein OraA/RecX